MAPQLGSGWQHNYSTKTRQVGHANEQSMYSLMSMISADQMSVDKIHVDCMSVGQIVFDQKAWHPKNVNKSIPLKKHKDTFYLHLHFTIYPINHFTSVNYSKLHSWAVYSSIAEHAVGMVHGASYN